MAGTLTVTGVIGPGNSLTAAVYTGITFYHIDTVNNEISFDQGIRTVHVSITAATTITATKSGSTYTLTIS